MLRFGGLKYKKLNSAARLCEEQNGSSASKNDGKMEKCLALPATTTPCQERLHNQLNGAAIKNVYTSRNASAAKKPRNNLKLIVSGLAGKSLYDSFPSKPLPADTTTRPTPHSPHFKLLSAKYTIESKRKINCKTRIYMCIKRILKRNGLSNGPKDARQPGLVLQSTNSQRVPALRSPNADYREIKTLLEKQNRALEYDVNLASCKSVEKSAFIKKITLNLLQSAVDQEEGTLVLQREQAFSVTGSVQSDLYRAQEYERLLRECWYHENLPRNHSLGLLGDKLPGSFLVRKSTTQSDCYALSLRVPPGSGTRIAHYLIVRTASDGYKIKGFQKEFSSLRALIVHHSVMPEALPVPLAVPRPADLVVKTKFEDDYETVFDLADAVRHQS